MAAERCVQLPPDRRPKGTPPSLAARLLLWRLQVGGHTVTLRRAPPGLSVRPAAPEEWDRLVCHAYELRDLLREERVS